MISASVLNGGITEEEIKVTIDTLFFLAAMGSVGHAICWNARENGILNRYSARLTKELEDKKHKKPPRPQFPVLQA